MDALLEKSLYDGNLVRLGPIDHEKDPEIESRWTHDASFMRLMYREPVRPMPPSQVKKKYEELEKEADEKRDVFPFRIRACADDRLIGLAVIQWIDWSNACGWVRLGIGAPEDRRKGYGREALSLLLRFAFDELSLYRLGASIAGYNEPALALVRQFGFVEETRRREALGRDGRRWDLLDYGLLAEEWRASASQPRANE
jgi:RimJ/RimL family protein N-acetyltransferase